MGGGGKGGGGSAYTPREEKDNLKSIQRAQIIDLVSEGPILGPVDGLASVYLDDTPVQNPNGAINVPGVDVAWRNGAPVQDVLPGVAAIENEVAVSVEVKADAPVVRTIINNQVDRVRVTVGVPVLVQTTDKADRVRTPVRYRIERGVDGSWTTIHDDTINGKTTVPYTRTYDVAAPGTGGSWSVRVVRVTPDSTTDQLQNKTNWYSYTEVIDARLMFPHSAVVGLRFDTDAFQRIPRRNYLIKGRIVRVPDNYDPETREYSGFWEGGFKLSWTDNPAWIFYDLVTHTRYGLGRYLSMLAIEPDKWTLYQIAQYCDQLVDDGFGGQEPRMTCNLYLSDARQAYDVLSDLASIFRGMPVWDGLQMGISQDIPQDAVTQANNASVVDGKFRYESSARKARHTAVRVEYINPDAGWQKDEVYVQDDAAVARYGLSVAKIQAFACTSRGQAYRAGKWLLVTEQLERQSVSFEMGQEGVVALPGDIVDTVDNAYSGARLGGRVRAVDGNTVTLDAPITLSSGQANWFHYLDQLNQVRRIQIFSPSQGDTDTLVLGEEPTGLQPWDSFNLATAGLTPRKWRVMAIRENRDRGTYAYSCLQHVPEKHAIIEQGLQFDPPPASLNGGRLPPIEQLQITFLQDSNPPQLRLTWGTPRVIEGITFEVKIFFEGRLLLRRQVADTEFVLAEVEQGSYTGEVVAINQLGQRGPATDVAFTVEPPLAPAQLAFSPTNFSITVRPVVGGPTSLGTTYEFYGGASQSEVEAQTHYLGRGFILDQQGLTPDTTYWYGVVAVNAVGRSAMTVGSSKTLLKPEDILQLIGPEIPNLDWAVELQELVDTNSAGLILLSDRAALVVNAEGRVTGLTVTAGSQASAVDFLADFVSFTDPDTLERNLYWDNALKTLVLKGQIRLLDGTVVSNEEDIRAYDGDTIYTQFEYSVSGTGSWHSPMAEGDVYVRSRVVTNGTPGSWSSAARIKGDQGIQGVAGSGIYRLETATGVFPSDTATASSLFAGYVGRPPVQDDVLTVYATSGGVLTTADSRMYDGAVWVTPKLFVDGDVIALGSIRGDRLVAGTEITAPRILAGEVIGSRFVTSEDTSPRVELDPASTWPLWIGSGNKTLENARLALDNAGNLTSASLTAHNTTLTGTLSAPNGIIKNAMLGTAAVDTLKVAGNAITVPLSVYTAGSTSSINSTDGSVVLASGTISEGSSNLFISGTCDLDLNQTGGDNSATITASLEIWVDGVERISRLYQYDGKEQAFCEFSLTVGSGSHTVQMRLSVGGNGYVYASKRSLFAILTKR